MKPLLTSLFLSSSLVVSGLVVCGLVLSGCQDDASARPGAATGERAPLEPRSEPVQRVEVASLAPSAAVLEFTFPGEVEGSRDVVLSSPLGGFVEAVLVKEGQRVKEGQALARLDTTMHAARRDQAKAEVEAAQRELERVKAMGEAVARAQKDAAETRLQVAEAGLKLAQAQVARSVVSAPFAGIVAQMKLEPGEVKGPGAPIARVLQLDPVKVTLSVADRDVGALEAGLPVRITTDALREVLQGKVAFVSPAGDPRTRAFRVDVLAPNPDRKLLPGMIARVKVSAKGQGGGLVIPQEVVVTRMNDVGVFLEKDGRAKWQQLELGSVVGEQVVVASGLSADDRIVVTGHRSLVDGDRLEIAREGRCCDRGRVSWGPAGESAGGGGAGGSGGASGGGADEATR